MIERATTGQQQPFARAAARYARSADHPRARWRSKLSEPRDAAGLVVFRVVFGAIVFVSALRFLAFGWIDQLYVMPAFHFRYWGLHWLPLPSAGLVYALFVVLALLGAMVAFGLFFRPAVAVLFVVFTYLQLVDVATYLNHYYLVSLVAALIFFMPLGRCFALDAHFRPHTRSAVLPAWCGYLLRLQVAIVYVNAGLAKATTDWLLHAQPLGIWLSARTSMPLIGPLLDAPELAFVAAWTGFLFDTTIAFWLSWKRTRAVAYLAVVAFHLMTRLLFPPIGMFPVIMVAAALVFFDPAWPRRCLALALPGRVAGPGSEGSHRVIAPDVSTGLGPGRRRFTVGAIAAGLFLLVQVAVPLRTHVYGGNVLWHEQGMRFSWRVMAREKSGSVTFIVRDPKSGREWHVPPARYLTRLQEREMAVQPDLLLQLAWRIAHDFEAAGHHGVHVFADARASLNGRPAATLVDPTVDLARQSDSLLAKRWILPAPAGAPPRLRPIAAAPL